MRTLLVALAFLGSALLPAGAAAGPKTIPVGGAPTGVAFARGSAWVALDRSLVRCALGITARGGRLVVTLAHDGPGELVRIDPASGAIVSRTTTGPGPQPPEAPGDRVRGGGALWIAHFIQGTVTRVPLAGGG